MLRIALLVALSFAAGTPFAAAAAPDLDCEATPVAPPCNALEAHVGTMIAAVGGAVDSLGDQPGHAVVNATQEFMCRAPENFHCRAVSGRPLFAGALDLCASSPPPPAPFRGLHWYAIHGGEYNYGPVSILFPTGVEPTLRNATTTHLAGTALEGESICHDHWPTLRALATLP